MSASLKSMNYETRYAEFFIDSEEDLAALPTLEREGTGSLSTIPRIMQGSIARLTDSDASYYRIRGDSSWVKIITGSGGAGGLVDYNTQVINKPTINGRTVEGNVTSEDIDVAPEPAVEGESLIIGG